MDQNRLNVTLGSEIAQSLQPWPQKTGPAKAFVLNHPVIRYAVALLACEVDQRRRLTGDRVLLLLLLGRYSGIDACLRDPGPRMGSYHWRRHCCRRLDN